VITSQQFETFASRLKRFLSLTPAIKSSCSTISERRFCIALTFAPIRSFRNISNPQIPKSYDRCCDKSYFRKLRFRRKLRSYFQSTKKSSPFLFAHFFSETVRMCYVDEKKGGSFSGTNSGKQKNLPIVSESGGWEIMIDIPNQTVPFLLNSSCAFCAWCTEFWNSIWQRRNLNDRKIVSKIEKAKFVIPKWKPKVRMPDLWTSHKICCAEQFKS